ncbi:carboxyl transferase domain-containing protein [Phenylobacterium sp.]|uniref:ATP-binding protein n=1 Tax=Phenylobacterium sp. TaxID=1871053 RepID=UPI0025DD97B1|nr:carboxyl transferase domain-containing protein [Phenylobacterium sp.]
MAVANRGEAAMRFLRTARSWSGCHRTPLETVALYTYADEGAAFTRVATRAVCLGEPVTRGADGQSFSTYLDIDKVIAAAKAAGADALWPGWGFASERPELVEACAAAGLAFLGPPASAMRALGDKIAAKRLAESCDVPVSPWSGGAVDEAGATEWAERIGYPVLLKATAGGGGRGIRRVERPGEIADALRSAAAEAAAAFGDPSIFVEALVTEARHIEVQILADQHGGVWALGTRDCSMQRRRQKILEEAPAPGLTPEVEAALCAAAVRLARACGYVNAGTAEFLLLPDGQTFYFLEMNTRLQVEHTVTEEVYGIDLVALQIDIASGLPLGDRPPAPRGVAIEARLNAEDPDQDFAPRAGRLLRFRLPHGPGVRVDSGYATNNVVPTHFDSMLAKIIAHGATRDEALGRLEAALIETEVVLDCGLSNRALLVDLVGRSAFRSGAVSTAWLDAHLLSRPSPADRAHLAAALAAAAIDDERRVRAGQVANFVEEAQRSLPRTLPVQGPLSLRYELAGGTIEVEVASLGPQEKRVRSGPWEARVQTEQITDWTQHLYIGGERFVAVCCATASDVQVEVEGVAHRFRRVSDGRVRAMLPAAVAQVHVGVGDVVAPGDRLVTLEAMKMETAVVSPVAGSVRAVLVRPSGLVAAGDVIVELDPAPDGGTQAAAAAPGLPPLRAAPPEPLRVLESRLLGFDVTADEAGTAMDALRVGPPQPRAALMRLVRSAVVQEQLFKSGPYDDAVNALGESSLSQLAWFAHHRRLAEERLSARMIRRLKRFLDLHGLRDDADPRVPSALMRLFQAREAEGSQSRLLLELLHALARLPPPEATSDAAGETDPPVEQRVLFEKLAGEALQRGDRQVATATWNLVHLWHDLPARQRASGADAERAAGLWARRHAAGLTDLPLDVLANSVPDAPGAADLALSILLARFYPDRVEASAEPVQGRIPRRIARAGGRAEIAALWLADPADFVAALRALPSDVEADVWLRSAPSQTVLATAAGDRRARWTALWVEAGVLRASTWRPVGETMREVEFLADLHPADPIARELARYSAFALRREPAPPGVAVFRATAGKDERLLAFARVETFAPVVEGDFVRVPHLEPVFLEAAQALRDSLRTASGRGPEMNRIAMFVRPPVNLTQPQLQALATRLAPASLDLNLETVSLVGRFTFGEGHASERAVEWRESLSMGPRIQVVPPRDGQIAIRSLFEQKVLGARRRGLFHPYEVVTWLTAPKEPGGPPRGSFEELELDGPTGERLVDAPPRAWGENPAAVVVGLATNPSPRFPEGLTRVLIIGDATMEMGALGEAECRRILAAFDLAEARALPVEWVAISSGARIALESGTENLDWTAAVLRRIIRFTQGGGVVNVIVDGPCVGAQSYWNAEATMLMHCRGALVMTPRGYMILTGKRALEVSGSVAGATNEAIGGLDIMLANGEAQYAAGDLHEAYDLLLTHYEYTHVMPGEARARAVASRDASDRDVRAEAYDGPGGFSRVGAIFDEATNPGRKKPFAIRPVIRAVADRDAPLLERWPGWADAETAVTMLGQLGGQPVCFLGIESQPVARRGSRPADGPAAWTSGTLFPQSSRKVARAIRSVSGVCPVVILANLSGFDGSPESMRERQLEFGAEIGKAVVEFDGPILFCVISRYHGGAYVVFSRRLSNDLRAIALEGSFASVIGGGAAAAVVFTRQVAERVEAHPRVRAARAELAQATEGGHRAAQERYEAVRADVEAEAQAAFAREFDTIHSVARALDVGSLHEVLPADRLRATLCASLAGPDHAPSSPAVIAAVDA